MENNLLVETHCHLDYLKSFEVSVVVESAYNVGVDKIITVSVSPDNQNEVVALTNQFSGVYCSQGVHPHEARNFNVDVEKMIISNIQKNPKVVTVGEIGLDYHYDNSPRDIQQTVFERQLEIAIDFDLPVIIHTREAEDDTLNIIKKHSSYLKQKGVVHCFSSSLTLAEFCLAEGFYLGFNGIITFKNATNVRDVLKITPMNRILLETDAPFLTPIPHRGKENLPGYLPYVAIKAAEVKEIELAEFAKRIYQNSCQLFNLLTSLPKDR